MWVEQNRHVVYVKAVFNFSYLTLLDKTKTKTQNIGFFLPIPKKTAAILRDTEVYCGIPKKIEEYRSII